LQPQRRRGHRDLGAVFATTEAQRAHRARADCLQPQRRRGHRELRAECFWGSAQRAAEKRSSPRLCVLCASVVDLRARVPSVSVGSEARSAFAISATATSGPCNHRVAEGTESSEQSVFWAARSARPKKRSSPRLCVLCASAVDLRDRVPSPWAPSSFRFRDVRHRDVRPLQPQRRRGHRELRAECVLGRAQRAAEKRSSPRLCVLCASVVDLRARVPSVSVGSEARSASAISATAMSGRCNHRGAEGTEISEQSVFGPRAARGRKALFSAPLRALRLCG